MAAVGRRVYFGATDGRSGVELWTSDGTRRGTFQVQDINPGSGSSSPAGFVVVGQCLYFAAHDGEHGFELWALPIDPVTGGIRSASSTATHPAVCSGSSGTIVSSRREHPGS
jgi:ELWxxDGT repeat protein